MWLKIFVCEFFVDKFIIVVGKSKMEKYTTSSIFQKIKIKIIS